MLSFEYQVVIDFMISGGGETVDTTFERPTLDNEKELCSHKRNFERCIS